MPAATDADGDALRISATNLPPWASIDPNDGRITGTPGEADEGVYESITIVVADAGRRAETKPFSITVMSEAATGVATLHDLDQSVLIDDPTVTTYEFTTLTKGIWYFAVVGVNSGGLEGPPTIITTKSI
jgi:hypothetical protein